MYDISPAKCVGQRKTVLQNDSVPYVTMPDVSPKLTTGDGNPLLDFMFTADPTAVEYNGRIYVYATNDQQQYDSIGGYGKTPTNTSNLW